jgi:hypothetical protein
MDLQRNWKARSKMDEESIEGLGRGALQWGSLSA